MANWPLSYIVAQQQHISKVDIIEQDRGAYRVLPQAPRRKTLGVQLFDISESLASLTGR